MDMSGVVLFFVLGFFFVQFLHTRILCSPVLIVGYMLYVAPCTWRNVIPLDMVEMIIKPLDLRLVTEMSVTVRATLI